jgi:hypothetical protein
VEANRRQLMLLGGILVLLAVVLYWQSARQDVTPEEFSAAMSQPAQASAGAAPSAPATSRQAGPVRIPAVKLGSLGEAQPEPSDTGRDPFRFESGPASAQRGVSSGRGAGAAPPAAPAAPAVPVLPAGPQEPPGPPPILLKFIGTAKQGTGRLYAVLRDDRGIYYGAEGDIVEGRYRILRVSADTVELSYTDGRGRTRIPLSGGQP